MSLVWANFSWWWGSRQKHLMHFYCIFLVNFSSTKKYLHLPSLKVNTNLRLFPVRNSGSPPKNKALITCIFPGARKSWLHNLNFQKSMLGQFLVDLFYNLVHAFLRKQPQCALTEEEHTDVAYDICYFPLFSPYYATSEGGGGAFRAIMSCKRGVCARKG